MTADWEALAGEKRARYESPHGELDERAVVRLGNVAYAAGLALLMAGSPDAGAWLRRAADRWRESWDLGAAVDAWGRPVGALKASLLAGDEGAVSELAAWTLTLGVDRAPSPIGRYAAALALLATGEARSAREHATWLAGRDDFPDDVAHALAAIADGDEVRLQPALASVVRSFEARDDYLEDVAVADTALVLARLARRRGLAAELPPSVVLP
ncbi:MAG TPA: hypothetical protein VLK36_11065 [Gaiellaceae bacterium]|nr:hypothetical protein [Gaiellaceae bacterium]